jgi:nitroreductase
MDTMTAITQRHSTRAYQPTPIERDVIERIVDAARRAPSASNQQPWEFVAVVDAALRRQIAELTDYGKFIADAPLCIAVFCRQTTYYVEDGSAATQNILLAATSEGLDSCWVAGDKKAYAEEIGKLLDAPQNVKLVSLVAIGYAQVERDPTPKRHLDDVIHWDRF